MCVAQAEEENAVDQVEVCMLNVAGKWLAKQLSTISSYAKLYSWGSGTNFELTDFIKMDLLV